ncbi:unnamed protein product [Peniophora sp. CBMAI 1063]|nr:unnamed protein product [Peniophora sp. CBMAI 1063]
MPQIEVYEGEQIVVDREDTLRAIRRSIDTLIQLERSLADGGSTTASANGIADEDVRSDVPSSVSGHEYLDAIIIKTTSAAESSTSESDFVHIGHSDDEREPTRREQDSTSSQPNTSSRPKKSSAIVKKLDRYFADKPPYPIWQTIFSLFCWYILLSIAAPLFRAAASLADLILLVPTWFMWALWVSVSADPEPLYPMASENFTYAWK